MVMCEYFSAASDDIAVGVLDDPGGPDPMVFDVLSLKGFDPVVVLARIEGIVTGCSYDEAYARPRSGRLLSDPEGDGAWIVSVSDTLQQALAKATAEGLSQSAEPVAAIEELRSYRFLADEALEILCALSALAQKATGQRMRLYCWLAL